MISNKGYQVIVGSGADADDGLDVYVVGDYPSLPAALDAVDVIKDDDRGRAWIDVLEDDGSNTQYFGYYLTDLRKYRALTAAQQWLEN